MSYDINTTRRRHAPGTNVAASHSGGTVVHLDCAEADRVVAWAFERAAGVLTWALALLLTLGVYFHYAQAILTNPGRPVPPCVTPPVKSLNPSL